MAHLPDGLRLYAVGDIHGRSDLLRRLLGLIEADTVARGPAQVRLMFLGDYIDRGPDSPGVLDLLMAARAWARTTCLRGNHEDALLAFVEDPVKARFWLDWGGLETMRAYGVSLSSDLQDMSRQLDSVLPDRHRAFLKGMPVRETLGDYLFVHAGVDPALPFDKQDHFTLTTIREPFLSWGKPLEKIVVHGHTISPQPELLSWRIGIDTGAYASGRLTALGLESNGRWTLST
jgi:serine/threonine protein phosphatase 1